MAVAEPDGDGGVAGRPEGLHDQELVAEETQFLGTGRRDVVGRVGRQVQF